MDCVTLVSELQAISEAVGPKRIVSILDDVKEGDKPSRQEINLLQPLVAFLNREDVIQCLREIQKCTTDPSWFDLLKDFIIEDPNSTRRIIRGYHSLGLSVAFTDLLVYQSGRPRVDMIPYVTEIDIQPRMYYPKPHEYILPQSRVLSTVTDAPDGVLLHSFTPVSRYQTGGIGYLTVLGGEQKEWCGTFYYYEPDSPVFIYATKALVTWNKITACLDLGVDIDIVYQAIYNARKDWIIFDDDDNETPGVPNNMGFQVEGDTKEEQWLNVIKAFQIRSIDPYVHLNEFNAAEDDLDQLVCQTAKDQGIDLIVLKYMTGEQRVVTEILDTRSRKESFDALCFPPMPL